MPRRRRRFPPAWRTMLVLGGLVVAAGSLAVVPPEEGTSQVLAVTEERPGDGGGGGGGPTTRTIVEQTGGTAGGGGAGLRCAPGANGGATDVGITGTSIKLGATVVDSGIGATFLRDARFGILAVKNKVNRRGGVCGRRLEVKLIDDGWSFERGGKFLKDLVEGEGVFALAVVPSSEGLRNVSISGYLERQGVPVVGSDGMLIHQYTDPSIWPVAASTISQMHVMAKQAHDAGARHFGIVYETKFRFGKEGALAFNNAVERLTGAPIPGFSDPLANPRCQERFCGIASDQGSYGGEINTFNSACGDREPKCDFIALLLEPSTALKWLTGGGLGPSSDRRVGGPQPLFTRSFAEECGERCHNMWLWTGYNPPIGANLGKPGIAEYVTDIKSTSTSADFTNMFTEGAYLGMSVLVKALEDVGPDLTRARLMAVLDGMTFESGLSAPLTWRPGNHFANVRVQAWSIQYKDRFNGWRDEKVSLADPWVGEDIPASET